MNELSSSQEEGGWSNKQIDYLVAETSRLTNSTKTAIKNLEAKNSRLPSGGDTNTRRTQVASVKKKFMDTIQRYQGVEQKYRQRTKQRIERQYRIVRPDASPEEVRAAVEDQDGTQIFSQAVCTLLLFFFYFYCF